MTVLEIVVDDELARELSPYQDELPELLELGLQARRATEQGLEHPRHALMQLLAASGQVTLPHERSSRESRTPVAFTGQPPSEIVIEQRK